MAGIATAVLLYCIWVLGVNGAIAPQTLADQSGTALEPLAAQVGPSVHVLGSAFVILGMGMASIHSALGLFNLARERLPTQRRPTVVVLPRRRGRLLFRPRGESDGDPRIALTYLGLEASPEPCPELVERQSPRGDQPQFRLDIQSAGDTHRIEMPIAEHWEDTELLDRFPDSGKQRIRLNLEVLDVSQESARLRVTSPMTLTYAGEWDTTGLSMTDVLTLPGPSRQLITWMMHRGEASLAEVVVHICQVLHENAQKGEEMAWAMLEDLVEQGFVSEREVEGESRYRICLAPKRGRLLPEEIWQTLGEEVDRPAGLDRQTGLRALAERAREVMLSERGRFFLSVSPVAITFLLTEWLLLTGRESFPGPLSFLGTIVVSLLGGIFPALLLVSSRRKGEFVPDKVYRLMGHPLLITGVYFLFLASIFLHGLVIWQSPAERAGALFVGISVLGLTIAMTRHGAFAPRLVVELQQTPEEREGVFAVTAGGQPATAEVRLGYPEGEQRYQAATGEVPTSSLLRYAIFQVRAEQARELKVWAHKTTPEGDSEGLPALLEVRCGDATTRFDLKLAGGQVTVPLTSAACRLEITFPEPST